MPALSTKQQMTIHVLSLAVVSLAVLLTTALQADIDLSRYNEGKKQYELVEQKSQMPKYGQCWRDAMSVMQTGCRRLDDVVQSRLALSYLNCFLQIQGKVTYPCSGDSRLEVCVRDMSDPDRSSFATFFAHTQDICYFLQAQVWQELTEGTIGRLEASSSQVAEQLETSHRLQQDLASSQNLSLHNQERLMSQAQNLSDIINASSKNVHFLFEDLKKSTLEQRQIIGDLFDQLAKLQSTILGEISGFYSLFYYVLSVFVCYLLTSASRTSGARFWLFLIMTINVIIEQSVMRWISSSTSLFGTDDAGNERLYWLQRQCRRVALVLSLLVLGLCVYLYKDINAINNRLLVEIRRQNSDLWRFDDVSDVDRLSLLDELSDLQKVTESSSLHIESWLETSYGQFHPKDICTAVVTLIMALSHVYYLYYTQGSPYNLRPRRSGRGGNISPAAQVETARSFSRTVHQMQQIAEKNSRLIRAMQQHGHRPGTAAAGSHLTPKLENGAARIQPYHVDDADKSSMLTRSSLASSRKH
ncbi:unnamed protein product [Candidula unifasciata]|uniref:Protein GAMETE EXPRESSED 1 n=1 Tax=Candidula unifasciata TaxID=100452 RepID=A0A8S4A7D1_9EUPU|nr:unnamed protein product [Candidula unifasciata]